MENELISIIVPVYNVSKYLERCISSIINQSYQNIEIILINDGSTDNSGEICNKYSLLDNRIKVIHKTNGGLSDARNCGIKNSSGDYIMFIDSDDVVNFNIVECLYNIIIKYDTDISICDCVHCYSDDIIFSNSNAIKSFKSNEAICELLYQKSFLVSSWGKLFTRKCFDNVLFPVNLIFEDSAIMYKIFNQVDKIVYTDAKLYAYMHRENSITTAKFSKKDCDILKICNEMMEYFSNSDDNIKKAVKSYCSSAALRIYLNAPRNDLYNDEINICIDYLKQNGKSILYDKNVRRKNKIAIIMFLYCRSLISLVYKRIDRWK